MAGDHPSADLHHRRDRLRDFIGNHRVRSMGRARGLRRGGHYAPLPAREGGGPLAGASGGEGESKEENLTRLAVITHLSLKGRGAKSDHPDDHWARPLDHRAFERHDEDSMLEAALADSNARPPANPNRSARPRELWLMTMTGRRDSTVGAILAVASTRRGVRCRRLQTSKSSSPDPANVDEPVPAVVDVRGGEERAGHGEEAAEWCIGGGRWCRRDGPF